MINLVLLDPTVIERDEPIPPVIFNVKNGIVFRDVKYDQFDEAIQFVKDHYLRCNLLWRGINVTNDPEALEAITERFRYLLHEDCSMVAVDEATGRILGVCGMKLMEGKGEWSHLRLNAPPPPVETVLEFEYDIMKSSEIFHKFDTSKILHIFFVCVARDVKGRLLKEELIYSAYKIAISVGATDVTWVCASSNDQERARRLGFTKVNQLNYGNYSNNSGRCTAFANLAPGEHYAEFFACSVPERQHASVGDWLLYN